MQQLLNCKNTCAKLQILASCWNEIWFLFKTVRGGVSVDHRVFQHLVWRLWYFIQWICARTCHQVWLSQQIPTGGLKCIYLLTRSGFVSVEPYKCVCLSYPFKLWYEHAIHILLTVLHVFVLVLVKGICLNIKMSYLWWPPPLFSWLEYLIMWW